MNCIACTIFATGTVSTTFIRLEDLLIEAGYDIEAGPGKHGVTQAAFYMLWAGGNRAELFGIQATNSISLENS